MKITFALSTRWNAFRHRSGEAMLEEILALGIDHVELGYDLRLDLVPGVKNMVRMRCVTVDSVHNFCPVPVGAPEGHPELFELASLDKRVRHSAVQHTLRTVELAAEMGAAWVVTHAGNVAIRNHTRKLIALYRKGLYGMPRYERVKLKLIAKREKKTLRHLDYLYAALQEILPTLTATKIGLALENLPSWEGLPSEMEMERISRDFPSAPIGYWHDFGHAQVRENLGFINHRVWFTRLAARMVGMHIHDVRPPDADHLMPPAGEIDFASFKECLRPGIIAVLEPLPGTPAERIREAVVLLKEAWEGSSRTATRTEP